MSKPPVCGKGCPGFVRDPMQLNQGNCHGWGPQAVVLIGMHGPGQLGSQPAAIWPPMSADSPGCPLHPDWPAYAAAHRGAEQLADDVVKAAEARLIH